jgi:hypothetical protein
VSFSLWVCGVSFENTGIGKELEFGAPIHRFLLAFLGASSVAMLIRKVCDFVAGESPWWYVLGISPPPPYILYGFDSFGINFQLTGSNRRGQRQTTRCVKDFCKASMRPPSAFDVGREASLGWVRAAEAGAAALIRSRAMTRATRRMRRPTTRFPKWSGTD